MMMMMMMMMIFVIECCCQCSDIYLLSDEPLCGCMGNVCVVFEL